MSLLMQALKKAEHAKQKQGGAAAEPAPLESSNGLALDEALSLSPKEAPRVAVVLEPSDLAVPAKAELQMSDFDLASGAEQPSSAPAATAVLPIEPLPGDQHSMRIEPHQPGILVRQQDTPSATAVLSDSDRLATGNPPAPPKPVAAQHQAAAQAEKKIATAQQQAKTVFASKQPIGKRRTLLIAGTSLAVCIMLAGAGYVYWQISSPGTSSLFPAAPAPLPVPAMQTEVPAPARIATSPAPGTAPAEPLASAMKPAAGTAPTEREATRPSSPAPALTAGTMPAADKIPSVPKTQTTATTQNPAANAIQIHRSVSANQIDPSLAGAYRSFISGDAADARQQYQTVLRKEPNNHDALLGLAAIALNQHQPAQAGALYIKLLELDPADPDAIAGLSGLQHGDPLQNESDLKKSLAQNPQSGAVLFALGNLYAQQSRWAEAQQIYFRAFASAPENPDFAFNLAVSLDRLNQAKLAQEYYQRALALAQKGLGNFSRSGVQSRITELQAATDN